MKPLGILLLALLLSCIARAQSVVVEVSNSAPFDRQVATVELPLPEIRRVFGGAAAESLGVFVADSQIVCQMVDETGDDTADVMIFQSGFKEGEHKTFVVRKGGSRMATPAVTDAKYILPRKDVAWENDRIAYRIYGGPLAGDVLNGLDVWVKRVRYHIIDKWYNGDSLRGGARVSYHVDHGEGADFFLTGRSLGAGGSSRMIGDKLDQAGLFSSYKIRATGPIRSVFTVTYRRDSSVMEEKTYTLDAGMNLNKIEVRYPSGPDSISPTAIGLVKRANTKAAGDADEGWLELWGRTDADSTTGFLGIGAVVPPASKCRIVEDSVHHLLIGTADRPNHFTYYAGAGWTKSGDFTTEDSWKEYISRAARALRSPLQVTIRIR
jgi:pectinesterase